MKPVYLDYNATTPIDPAVAAAMTPFINTHYGNPSSSHLYGITAKMAVESARKQVADMLKCDPEEIIFTSGGTESNNLAIKGVAHALRERGNHIITSQIEHPAVTEVCRFLEGEGFVVTYLPVDKFGLVDPSDVEKNITPQTILISIMHANNEVGTIQFIPEIAEIARKNGVLMHSDCAQSVGKVVVQADVLGVDLISVAGHKLYAPKGIGALYVRNGVVLEKTMHGANHERNIRAGTENVIEIVGLGKACELVTHQLDSYGSHMEKMRDSLEKGLREKLPQIQINGHPEKRLPNTSSISFKGVEANTILAELDTIAASAGAACHSDQIDVSTVLQAMKVPVEFAMGTIRLSVGRYTTATDVDFAVRELVRTVDKLRPRENSPVFISTDTDQIHLTRFTHGLGCACKLRPQLLEQVLKNLPHSSDSNVLVGNDLADDAAVYKLDDQNAIVQTVDFFTPIVDSPYDFGAISAANSLSDIYAMGGKPLFALNVVGFPSNRLPIEVLQEILAGAQAKVAEAGISIIGGHTVDDSEPKFGLAVTGWIHPHRIFSNAAARPGDSLVITKPLGTGILSTALKRGALDKYLERLLIDTMASLNKLASETMVHMDAHACTDITGFGLMGHLLEMMQGSSTSAVIYEDKIPLLDSVEDFVAAGMIPGGSQDNLAYTRVHVNYPKTLSENRRLILSDAQTSGGLLVSLPVEKANAFVAELKAKGLSQAAVIGEVIIKDEYPISVV